MVVAIPCPRALPPSPPRPALLTSGVHKYAPENPVPRRLSSAGVRRTQGNSRLPEACRNSARFAVHRLDQDRDVLGRRLRHDAVPEVEDVAGAGPAARTIAVASRSMVAGSVEQHQRVEIALQRHAIARRGGARRRCRRSSRGPRPTRREAAISSSQTPPPLVNTIVGTRRPSGAGSSAASTARIGASENRRYAAAVSMPPQVSKIITASAPRGDLLVEVRGDRLRVDVDDARSRSGRAYAIRRTVAKSSLPPPSIM